MLHFKGDLGIFTKPIWTKLVKGERLGNINNSNNKQVSTSYLHSYCFQQFVAYYKHSNDWHHQHFQHSFKCFFLVISFPQLSQSSTPTNHKHVSYSLNNYYCFCCCCCYRKFNKNEKKAVSCCRCSFVQHHLHAAAKTAKFKRKLK